MSIKKRFFKFLKRPLIKKASAASVLMFFTALIILAFSWKNLPPQTPLYFSLPWGKAQLVYKWKLFFLPIFILIIFINNFLLAFFFIKKNNHLLLRILIFSSLFTGGILLYSLIRIVLLITWFKNVINVFIYIHKQFSY